MATLNDPNPSPITPEEGRDISTFTCWGRVSIPSRPDFVGVRMRHDGRREFLTHNEGMIYPYYLTVEGTTPICPKCKQPHYNMEDSEYCRNLTPEEGKTVDYRLQVKKVYPNAFYSNCMHGIMNYNGKGSEVIGVDWQDADPKLPAPSTTSETTYPQHARNCAAWTNAQGDECGERCTCGLKWRIALSSEQSLHNAWRKRAEEAETELNKLKSIPPPTIGSEGALTFEKFWKNSGPALEDQYHKDAALYMVAIAAWNAALSKAPQAPLDEPKDGAGDDLCRQGMHYFTGGFCTACGLADEPTAVPEGTTEPEFSDKLDDTLSDMEY